MLHTDLRRQTERVRAWRAAAAMAIVAACGSGRTSEAPPHAGTATVHVRWGGTQRTYLLHRPAHLPAGGSPAVVVVLHGASLTAEQTERYYHWDDLADSEGFVVAYPQGLDKAWNAGSCCGLAPGSRTDDVGFVGSVLDDVSRAERGDVHRLYLTGVSNGAMLALRFACQRPGTLAAVGSVAGTFTAPCDHPPAVSLIEIHGLDDRAVPYLPGPGTAETGAAMRLPARETIDRWRTANGCGTPAVTSTGPVHVEIAACRPPEGPTGVDVNVITVDGAGHQWPGATLDAARAAFDGPHDQPDTHVDATRELWRFFSAHRLG